MKNKFTLTGTDNDGFRHRYSIKKSDNFKEAFVKFMIDLGFEENRIKKSFIGIDANDVEIALKPSEIEDDCWYYQNKKYDVDVFFGRFKVILVVRTKFRIPMIKYLENKTKWVKLLKMKVIKEKQKETLVPLKRIRGSN